MNDDHAHSGPPPPDHSVKAHALAWSRGMRLQSLGNLAHELRTPLQVLIGYLDILRDELSSSVSAATLEILERMNSNVYELAQTIDNLMEHAMAEAQAAPPKPIEEIAVRGLIGEILPVLEAANARKRLRLLFDTEQAPPTIRAPRGALRSILVNLALNAIKFTDSGSVRIALRSVGTRDEEIEIEVSDTGPGISQTMFKQALKPFAQLSEGSDRRYRGLGLGLSVTHRNVVSLGGRFELASTNGAGSRFNIRFPMLPRPQPFLPATGKGRGRLPVSSQLPAQSQRGKGAGRPR